MKQRAVIGFCAVLFSLSLIATVRAQYVFPTPSPTPKPSPTPAQPPGPPPCPTVGVNAQGGQRVRDGQKIGFTANIAGGDPKVIPTIVWNTSAGYISDGNNTRRIEVDTTGAGATQDREVKAEVWVGGYAPECLLQASASVKIIPPATKYGEFGVVDEQTLKTNLDAVSTFLAQSPDNLFLIAYAGRNSERGFTYNWIRKMKEAILAPGMSPRRVAAIDGGFREEPMFEFWIVPLGADPPRPTPTLKRTDIVTPSTTPPRRPQ